MKNKKKIKIMLASTICILIAFIIFNIKIDASDDWVPKNWAPDQITFIGSLDYDAPFENCFDNNEITFCRAHGKKLKGAWGNITYKLDRSNQDNDEENSAYITLGKRLSYAFGISSNIEKQDIIWYLNQAHVDQISEKTNGKVKLRKLNTGDVTISSIPGNLDKVIQDNWEPAKDNPSVSIDLSSAKTAIETVDDIKYIVISNVIVDYDGLGSEGKITLNVKGKNDNEKAGNKIETWKYEEGKLVSQSTDREIKTRGSKKIYIKYDQIKDYKYARIEVYGEYFDYEAEMAKYLYDKQASGGMDIDSEVQTMLRLKVKDKSDHKDDHDLIKLTNPRIISTKYIKRVTPKGETTPSFEAPESWDPADWDYANQKPTVTVDENEDVDSNKRYKLTKQDVSNLNLTYGDRIVYNIRFYNVGDDDADFMDKSLEIELMNKKSDNEPIILKKDGDYYYIYDYPNDNLKLIQGGEYNSRYNIEKISNGYRIRADALNDILNYNDNKDKGVEAWSQHIALEFEVTGGENATNVDIENNGRENKRDDKRIKFLYSFTYKDKDGVEHTKFVDEPTAKVDTSKPVGDEGRFSYVLGEAPNATIMDGDKLTYCIRYYSIGMNSTKITYSIPDTFGDGLEYVSGSAVRQDGKPIGVTQNGNTLTIEPPNVLLDGYEEGEEVPHYDIFLTFTVNVKDPSKTPILINDIGGDGPPVKIVTGYEIKGKVFIDEKKLDNGKLTEPANGIFNNGDTPIEGMKVQLLTEDGKLAVIEDPETGEVYDNEAYTDSNGEYTFTHLRSKEIYFDNKGNIDEEKSQDLSKPYIIRFTYNGQVYENIQYAKDSTENSSYSTELRQGELSNIDSNSREDFNNKFTTIDSNNSSTNTLIDRNTGDNTDPNTLYAPNYSNKDVNCPENYVIHAYSGNARGVRTVNVDTAYKEYVNLGIIKREFDLELENKLDSIDISINGVGQKVYSQSGGMITSTVSEEDLEEDLYLKESDYTWDKDESKELSIWINYTITVKNNSVDNFIGKLKEVKFYYRKEFDNIVVQQGSQKGGITTSGKFKYVIIEPEVQDIDNKADSKSEIKVSIHLNRKTIKESIEYLKRYETIAEINSYQTSYNGDIFNNGHTGNAGKIDCDSDAGNMKIDEYENNLLSRLESNNPTNIIEDILNFFNEDDAMSAVGLKLKKDDNPRRLEGIVFEDKTERETISGVDGYKRLGDGETDDKKVEGVTVELYDGDELAKNYAEQGEPPFKVTSDINGKYIIEGFIPSENYRVKFTYGDGNTGIYNAQDYKSTIDTTEDSYTNPSNKVTDPGGKEYTNSPDDSSTGDNATYWYNKAKVSNHSVAKDTDMKMQGKKFDKDVAEKYEKATADPVENSSEYTELQNELKNTAETAKIFAPIRKLGNTETKEEEYIIGNINLGLAERPRAELQLEKVVDHINIKATDGTTLIDGSPEQGAIQNVSYTKNGYVQPIIDENLIYGSQLTVTYKFKITNTGEVDFYKDDSTRDFYDLGESLGQDYIVKTYVSQNNQIVDYVDDKLKYDGAEEIFTENSDVQGDHNEDYWQDDSDGKIILVDNKFNKELKPGESTDYAGFLTLTKVLPNANLDELLTYNNYAEIKEYVNSAGRRCYSTWTRDNATDIEDKYLLSDINVETERGIPEDREDDTRNKDKYILSIPGNLGSTNRATVYKLVGETTETSYRPYGEPDSTQAEEIQVIQPFGSTKAKQIIIWTSTAIVAIAVFGIGIYLIKKKVL